MSDSRFHGVFSSLLKDSALVQDTQQASGSSAGQGDDVAKQEQPVPKPAARAGQIAVDLIEEGEYLIIKAPIAGVKLADLDIDVTDNVITIRGERKQTDEFEENQYLVQECYWGAFERSVTLPHAVNPSKVKATFSKDNILKIFVPRDDAKKVKIVKINEGG